MEKIWPSDGRPSSHAAAGYAATIASMVTPGEIAIIVAISVAFVALMVVASRRGRTRREAALEAARVVCERCGSVVNFEERSHGWKWPVIIVGLFLVVAILGIILILVALAKGSYKACPECGGTVGVPIDSPRGRQLLAAQQPPAAS